MVHVLQAGLVVASDTVEFDAAPILQEEALARLGESLQRDLSRAISVVITETVPADYYQAAAHMEIAISSLNWDRNAGSTIWLL